jgi:hypothetical protein
MQVRASFKLTGLTTSGQFVEEFCRLYFLRMILCYGVCYLVINNELIIRMRFYFPCLTAELG